MFVGISPLTIVSSVQYFPINCTQQTTVVLLVNLTQCSLCLCKILTHHITRCDDCEMKYIHNDHIAVKGEASHPQNTGAV